MPDAPKQFDQPNRQRRRPSDREPRRDQGQRQDHSRGPRRGEYQDHSRYSRRVEYQDRGGDPRRGEYQDRGGDPRRGEYQERRQSQVQRQVPDQERRQVPGQRPDQRRAPGLGQNQSQGQNMVVTVLGFVGVAVLVVLSVMFVRIITGQQSIPAPKAPAPQSTPANNTTTNQGQARVEDWESAPQPEESEFEATEGTVTSTTAYGSKHAAPNGSVTINAMMIGDVLMHTEVVDSGRQSDGTYNYDHLFEHIKEDVNEADIRILNQETNLVTEDYGYGMVENIYGPTFGTPQSLADSENKYGFNVILKATNHTYDMGYDGLACELDYWKEHFPKIPVIGVNNPKAASDDKTQDYVNNVYVYEKDGFKVAIINHTFWSNAPGGDDDHAHMNFLEEDKIREDVKRAKEAHADMIIACPHWGAEFETTPNDEEVKYAQFFADEGVDVIFGGHPHILQPAKVLEGKNGHKCVCYYSAGNYVAANAMGGTLLVGGLNKVQLVKEADGKCRVKSAKMVPLVIHRATGTDMTTYRLADYTDELAATSQMPNITPAFVTDFVANLFGEGYDSDTSTYTLPM